MGFGMPRTEGVEASLPQQFPPFGNPGPMYNPANAMGPSAAQQMQYQQQNMMSRGAPPMNNFFPNMQAGFGGFQTPSPSIDQYRSQNLANGSPVQPAGTPMHNVPGGHPPYGNAGFGMNMGMNNNFAYGGMGGMQNMAYMQEQVNARRGRVGRSPKPERQRPSRQ